MVICVGNICRSPVGERILRDLRPELRVESAGLGALVGHAADETMTRVAARHGVSLEGHEARQFDAPLAQDTDLLLVMEPGHKREITRLSPHLSGRVMLFDQWTTASGIRDPYRRAEDVHEDVFFRIREAAERWADKLK